MRVEPVVRRRLARPASAPEPPVLEALPRAEGQPERLALFLVALHPGAVDRLAGGLAPRVAARTRAYARNLLAAPSSDRHALLATEFGPRPDALDRVQALIVAAPPALRTALVQQLPDEWKRRFPQHTAPSTHALAPVLAALASRLIREATRAG